ncbi:gamma-tubulin complex component 5-like [Mytilus galloprovincialis]|uniref:gamma-tubulin complex component 5-like n=1 Tax=Mytilus galloprovincialis TaxID=29158 RepID=UPI003F7CC0B5
MARWKNNFEPDIRNLITLFTGFSEEEDNFKICFQFADSNIKYHRFLSVDSHKVTQSLKGVIDKCTIHSEQRKANTLKTLTDEFLETPVFEGKKEGKTDTHYGLLSLLLHLAESPTHCSYDGDGLVLQTEEPEDDFDWTAFLLDGEYRPLQVYDDLESDSEEETLTEDDEDEDKKTTKDQNSGDFSSHVTQQNVTLSTIAAADSTTFYEIDDVQPSDTGLSWLQKNLVVQYWQGHGCTEEGSEGHDSCNLTHDWEAYKQASNPLYGEPGHVLITETMLIREVLWMLFGVKDSFIFVYTGEKFLIRDSIVLSHLTEKMVDSVLYDLTKYGGYIQKLEQFEQEVTSCSYHANSDDNIISQTYQSFQSAVALGFLDSFKKEITRIEKIIVKQEETITLSSLHATLKPWLHKLDILYSVYVKGIKEAEWLPSNYQKSSHLISVLYEAITEFDALGEFSKDVVDLLLPLWIQTTKPYIDIIDNWITNGVLCDPRLEFIVRRNESVKSLDEKFWEIAFTIHVPEDDPSKSKIQDQTDVLDDTSTFSEFFSHWAPQFLQPVLVEIILAGKSMELLQDLGKLAEVVGHKGDMTYKATPLYTMFLDSLQDMLGTKNNTKDFQQEKTTQSYTLFSPHIEQQMKIKGIYDPLLRINFEAIFSACVNNLERSSLGDTSYNDWLTVSLVRDGLQPIDQLLQKCLYPHIKHKYVHVCSKLVQILKEEYHLMEYLATMRHFFLMEAGDTMFDFYTQIFDMIRLNEHWRDASVLNLCLHEALQARFPEEINRLDITVESLNPNKEINPINITDCVKLQFKVPWPVNVVINSQCQQVYNEIFCFLLQIKRAKYCLDELRFFDLEKDNILHSISTDDITISMNDGLSQPARIHRMQVLRMRLLHFVNSLHNYIMTRILHSTGLEFKEELQKATDLDQIISVHTKFVNKIHERCLLHKKVAFLKEAVMRVLNLILTFQSRWDQGIQEVSVKTIVVMETEFSRCIQFLSSFLNNVIKRGSFPHLESLAFALITSTEHVVKN